LPLGKLEIFRLGFHASSTHPRVMKQVCSSYGVGIEVGISMVRESPWISLTRSPASTP
jgi:hypothetical protein